MEEEAEVAEEGGGEEGGERGGEGGEREEGWGKEIWKKKNRDMASYIFV